jgi:glycyl-tRNA synthetase beta chain
MSTADLLFELGCEELPAAGLSGLAQGLRDGLLARLQKAGIDFDAKDSIALWTPRRLTVRVAGVALKQPDQQGERRGPAVSAGLDGDGQPSRALLGFAQSCGVAWTALERIAGDKGEWFVHRQLKPGADSRELLPALINEAVAALPLPKPMRWGSREQGFLRPVHWVVALLGDDVLDLELFGHRAGRTSYGHRFHHPEAIEIMAVADYEHLLEQARVLVDPCLRRQRIRAQVEAAAAALGGKARLPEDLLDEVMNLTEWPVAIGCELPADFMRLPDSVIIATIETHQRFFPVVGADGALLPAFIGVANLESRDPAQIQLGYQRVVRPRLADAAFFYDQDLKTPLQNHLDDLDRVTYQAKLGSVLAKTERVIALARAIAPAAGVDPEQAAAAARLAKCDLMSLMVGEFPELQGSMGRTYALAQGQQAAVADALDEVYAPRQAGAPIAPSALGRVLAIAERLDTLAGIFAVGLKPTGSKDPFALRRAALGLARTLIEGGIRLDLVHAIERAVAAIPPQNVSDWIAKLVGSTTDDSDLLHKLADRLLAPAVDELYGFILERTRAYYLDGGISADVFEAVAARRPHDLLDFDRRLRAVLAFKALPECASLAAANKRSGNLLRKAVEAGEPISRQIDPGLFEGEAEAALANALTQAEAEVTPLLRAQDYVAALSRLALLQGPVDGFFESVMVMSEDAAVRANRLGLLARLQALFLHTADVSALS